jgi:hypothetical protein
VILSSPKSRTRISTNLNATDSALILWYVLTFASTVFVAYDLAVNTPEMTVMKWGWILVTLYTGPIGLFIYLLAGREPLPGRHKQIVGGILAFPVNYWLVATGLKHGMGTVRALGKGGHDLATERELIQRKTDEMPRGNAATAMTGMAMSGHVGH